MAEPASPPSLTRAKALQACQPGLNSTKVDFLLALACQIWQVLTMSDKSNDGFQEQEPIERKSYREATQHIFDAQERARLRDVFAAAALTGLATQHTQHQICEMADGILGGQKMSAAAYVLADAMLAEREKGKK